jgi:hypothetical protein
MKPLADDETLGRVYRPGLRPGLAGHPGFGYRQERIGDVLVERDITVPVRDGARLYADVFRPAGGGPAPVIMGMAPFGKHPHIDLERAFPGAEIPVGRLSPQTPFECFDPIRWVGYGYAVAFVDTRGNWFSEGDATFFTPQEATDGYDIVEWLAAQPWCTGRVAIGGVSYYGMTGWAVAATRPPHLAAIMPWDAASDIYRETAFHGGIPTLAFHHSWMWLAGVGQGRVEDQEAGIVNHPMLDAYWQCRVADWQHIEVPTYAVTGWANDLHLRGTLEAWQAIRSPQKYLDVHGGKEWKEFYTDAAVARQRAFFDHFLKDIDNEVPSWPQVRLARRTGGSSWKYRAGESWPRSDVAHRPLYLDAGAAVLSEKPVENEASLTYLATDEEGRAEFDFRFAEPTELMGYVKLRLWVAALDTNDADLFVALKKLDADGNEVPFVFSQMFDDGPAAVGWLRVSHRGLEETVSRPERPWHTHARRELLTGQDPVPVDVEIWPTSISFAAGESLRLVVQGSDVYKSPGPFGVTHWPLHNFGRHVIHAGGRYDSHLLVPVVPSGGETGVTRAGALPLPGPGRGHHPGTF